MTHLGHVLAAVALAASCELGRYHYLLVFLELLAEVDNVVLLLQGQLYFVKLQILHQNCSVFLHLQLEVWEVYVLRLGHPPVAYSRLEA